MGQSPKGGCAYGAVPAERPRQCVGGRYRGSRCTLLEKVG